VTQLTFDDAPVAATEKRDDAIERAEIGAGHDWNQFAEVCVRAIAAICDEFTADDIWEYGLTPPREPRALGAVLMRLSRGGTIAKTGRYVATKRASRNAAPIAVWRAVR